MNAFTSKILKVLIHWGATDLWIGSSLIHDNDRGDQHAVHRVYRNQ
jgi:hypothetical protein